MPSLPHSNLNWSW